MPNWSFRRLPLALGLAATVGALTLAAPARAAVAAAYRHPIGLTFSFPDDWQVRPSGSRTLLVPPEVVQDPGSATGVYFFQVGAAPPEITRADDPAITRALDDFIAQTVPFLQRIEAPEVIESGVGPGVALTWDGMAPDGTPARARIFAGVSRGLLFQVVALGARDPIAAREEALRAITASFAPADAERDPALVGVWRFEKTEFAGDDPTRPVLQDIAELRFDAEGSSLYTETHRNFGDEQDTGPTILGVRARWFAGSGTLCLVGENGTLAQIPYELRGSPGSRTLTLADGDRVMEFTEVP